MDKLWKRIKYRKQLKKGFGLLSDLGVKKDFVIYDGKAFLFNGRDPLVRVDLSTNKVEQYKLPGKARTYKYKVSKVK